jgi:hypothetical protein
MKRCHSTIEQQIIRNVVIDERILITVQSFKKYVDVFSLSEIEINHRHVFNNKESHWSNCNLQDTFESESRFESHAHRNDFERLN